MKAADLAAIIPGGAHRRGEWYDSCCPAHEDARPSLSFRDESGRVRLLCRAGCSLAKITGTLGIRLTDLFHDRDGKQVPRVVAEYEYRDEKSELLYVVERREPKDFRQRQPDGAGSWLWKL